MNTLTTYSLLIGLLVGLLSASCARHSEQNQLLDENVGPAQSAEIRTLIDCGYGLLALDNLQFKLGGMAPAGEFTFNTGPAGSLAIYPLAEKKFYIAGERESLSYDIGETETNAWLKFIDETARVHFSYQGIERYDFYQKQREFTDNDRTEYVKTIVWTESKSQPSPDFDYAELSGHELDAASIQKVLHQALEGVDLRHLVVEVSQVTPALAAIRWQVKQAQAACTGIEGIKWPETVEGYRIFGLGDREAFGPLDL